jgi:tetratricopeptide (TPR) repeat protein
MNKPASNNDKSLIPLIIFLSIIVLLTVWIVNIDVDKHKGNEDDSHLFEYKKNWSVMSTQKVHKTSLPHRSSDKFHFNTAAKIAEVRRCLEKKQLDKAEDMLKTVLVFEPDNTTALSMLGGIYYYSGRYPEAELIFKKESVILPESARIYNSLASAQARQKKYSAAISSGQKALSLNPNIPQIHINLAGMYSISGNTKKALEHFRKAYKKLGSSILPLMNDPAFNHLRNSSEYQLIISKKKKTQAHNSSAERKDK